MTTCVCGIGLGVAEMLEYCADRASLDVRGRVSSAAGVLVLLCCAAAAARSARSAGSAELAADVATADAARGVAAAVGDGPEAAAASPGGLSRQPSWSNLALSSLNSSVTDYLARFFTKLDDLDQRDGQITTDQMTAALDTLLRKTGGDPERARAIAVAADLSDGVPDGNIELPGFEVGVLEALHGYEPKEEVLSVLLDEFDVAETERLVTRRRPGGASSGQADRHPRHAEAEVAPEDASRALVLEDLARRFGALAHPRLLANAAAAARLDCVVVAALAASARDLVPKGAVALGLALGAAAVAAAAARASACDCVARALRRAPPGIGPVFLTAGPAARFAASFAH